jgi:protoporphyrinogen oxidase
LKKVSVVAQVVIIGAGLTGLSVAYHLEHHNFSDYIVFERESVPGGLCRSIRANGFTFDYTGHFFHSPSSSIIDFLQSIMPQPLVAHQRRSFIYSQKTYSPYPYQTNLHGLPTQTIIDCIQGYIQRTPRRNTANFKNWVLSYFGTGFAQHFFFPYQEKIFDFPVSKLRTGWQQAVPQTSLEEILIGALYPRDLDSKGYNAQFWYPKSGGIDNLIKAMHEALERQVHFNTAIEYIDIQDKYVQSADGRREHYEFLVSTAPLNHFLSMAGMAKQAQKLLCNSIININLGIKRPLITTHHWVYYPEKKYPFFRIGFPHTLDSMVPEGQSSLSIEISSLSYPSKDQIANSTEQAVKHIQTIFGLQASEISFQQTLVLPHAYVIYDRWREQHVDGILGYLEQKNIYSAGRYGAWKYSSMYNAIVDGHTIAQKLIKEVA